ncbi:repeat domain (List_Bact_rpt) [Oscillospiraceae bacterium]|nr:repeat domain (List_Bact_rpt) [Oscillospiraceae bacterium]
MKGRKSMKSRFLAVLASAAIMVGTLSATAFADVPQSGNSDHIGFGCASHGFNVVGLVDGNTRRPIQTTFANAGYTSVLKLGNQTVTTENTFEYGKEFIIYGGNQSLLGSFNVTAAVDTSGQAVVLTYTITNYTTSAQEMQIASYSDCEIGNDDGAHVRDYAGVGLTMTNQYDGTQFYLLPGNANFTSRWSGRFGQRTSNAFTNSAQHNFTGDSGLAWSWTVNVPAGSYVTRTCTIAVGADLTSSTLSFDANGGEGTMDSTSLVTGVAGTIPANTFTREHYDFLGWSTDPNATAPDYLERSQITIEGDTVLYAVWARHYDNPTYTAPEAVTGLTYNGQPQALATAGSTEDGTMLYSLDPNGTFSDVIPTGTASGDYTVYYMVDGDEYHYDSAVESFGVSIAPLNVNVYFDGTPVSVNAEAAVDRPEDPTNDGYVFSGWFTDTDCTTLYDFSQPVGTSDIYLYSGWNIVVYTFTEGAGSSFVPGSEDPIVLRAVRNIDEPSTFSHFTGVIVDGEPLDPSLYTAESGSVIVTIGADYLNTLPEGTHTIQLTFDDAAPASTSIVISSAPVEPTESSETSVPAASTLPSETAAPVETTSAPTAAPTETAAPAAPVATEATTAPSASVLGVSREVEETTTTTAASEETTTTTTAAAATATPTPAPSSVAATGEASNASRIILGVILVATASCFVMKIRKEEN